jgi:hypothetical protein
MKPVNVETADTETLLAEYRASAVAHGIATEEGDHRKANRHHDAIAKIYGELRHRGDEARRVLLVLLDDINPHVRAWAAAHALDFAPDRGEPVLRRLASGQDVVGLNADMTLQEWQKGSLHFP